MFTVVFRHVPFEDLGWIAGALETAGISWQYADLYRDSTLPDCSEAAGLIFMGGPMSVNDSLPFLRREMQVIESALRAGQPVLGVCLGAQLVAKALGARVYRNPVKEIGWFPVWWKDAARGDALFAGLEAAETVFHWHGETFDLPRGAEWLAASERCAHQAFRYGSAAWGLQFHLEGTPEMVAGWCQEDANCGDLRELEGPLDPYANAGKLRELSALVFGRWARLVRERMEPCAPSS